MPKPHVDRTFATTHQASRAGTDIDHIVIHYTTSDNIEGTIDHFINGDAGTSAHYIVGRDGELVQMVPDNLSAQHARNMNRRSIGIEHVAKRGQRLTPEQSDKSLALVRWLMATYAVPRANVIPHKCVGSTDCFGDILADYGATIASNCTGQREAVSRWLASVGL